MNLEFYRVKIWRKATPEDVGKTTIHDGRVTLDSGNYNAPSGVTRIINRYRKLYGGALVVSVELLGTNNFQKWDEKTWFNRKNRKR